MGVFGHCFKDKGIKKDKKDKKIKKIKG